MPKTATINTALLLQEMSFIDAGRTLDLISMSDTEMKCFVSTITLSKRWKLSRQHVYRFLCKLRDTGIASVDAEYRRGYTVRFTRSSAVPFGYRIEESSEVFTESAEDKFLNHLATHSNN